MESWSSTMKRMSPFAIIVAREIIKMIRDINTCGVGLLKPDYLESYAPDEALMDMRHAGFAIRPCGQFVFDTKTASDFYEDLKSLQDPMIFHNQIKHMTGGPSFLFLFSKEGKDQNETIRAFRMLIGATKPGDRTEECLRTKYGDPEIIRRNAFHASDSPEAARHEAALLMEPDLTIRRYLMQE